MEGQEKIDMENISNTLTTMNTNSVNKIITFKVKDNYLETERANFLKVCSDFVDKNIKEEVQVEGRPKISLGDRIKSLLILTLNGLSIRRVESDLILAKNLGLLERVPKKSTINKYMQDKTLIQELEKLIQYSAMLFYPNENTLIVDSTWFVSKMNMAGYKRKPYGNKEDSTPVEIPSLEKCRKLHIGCLPNSKIIVYAKTSLGVSHDCPTFKDIINTTVNNGLILDRVLADSGYMSKDNYSLCQELGVKQAFIDFKKSVTGKRAQSGLWREAFRLYKNKDPAWHENYRYRVIVESVFSTMKRKFVNWLRNKNEVALSNEILLKALCYNLTVLGRYIDQTEEREDF